MPTDTFVNFYELLQVPPTANADQIREAIKRQRKTWQKRQNAPDPTRRAQAEEKMRHLDEANRILLNASSRTSYDQQLANYRPPAPTAGPSSDGSGNWLERARDFLARGDLHSAAYAAREATTHDGSNHEAWAFRAETSLLTGEHQAAIFEYGEAIRINGNEPGYHFDLGTVYEEMGQWNQALGCYERAASIAPQVPVFRLAVAGVHLQNDRPDLALPLIERVYAEDPHNEVVNYYLANALNDSVVQSLTLLNDGTRIVTTEQQARNAVSLLERARGLTYDDPDTKQLIEQNLKLANDALAVKWRRPSWLRESFWSMWYGGKNHPDGLGRGVKMASLGCMLWCLMPAAILIGGGMLFGARDAGTKGGGFLIAAAAIGLLYFIFYKTCRVPGWKIMDAESKSMQVRR